MQREKMSWKNNGDFKMKKINSENQNMRKEKNWNEEFSYRK